MLRYVEEGCLREVVRRVVSASGDQRLDLRMELYEVSSAGHKTSDILKEALFETYGASSDAFTRRADPGGVANYVNQTLGAAVDRRNGSSLMAELWRVLRSVVSPSHSEVYELNEDVSEKPSLWQFVFLWFDKNSQRILVLGCRARSKAFIDSSDSEVSEDSRHFRMNHSSSIGALSEDDSFL